MTRPYESGTWMYNISVPSEDTGKTAMVIVHLNVKPNGITLQGFLDEPVMLDSVKVCMENSSFESRVTPRKLKRSVNDAYCTVNDYR